MARALYLIPLVIILLLLGTLSRAQSGSVPLPPPAPARDTTMLLPEADSAAGSTSSIKVLPNTENGSFLITGTWVAADNRDVVITISDKQGHIISQGSAITSQGEMKEQITLGTDLPPGIYMVQLVRGSESRVFHFVRQ